MNKNIIDWLSMISKPKNQNLMPKHCFDINKLDLPVKNKELGINLMKELKVLYPGEFFILLEDFRVFKPRIWRIQNLNLINPPKPKHGGILN